MYSFNTNFTKQLINKRTACALLVLSAVLGTGCSTLDYKRMVYDALRQHDCRTNDPAGEFCSRTFALDYYDYKALRSDYLTALADDTNVTGGNATESGPDTFNPDALNASAFRAAEVNVN